jgi:hypothetical protein
MILTTRDHSMSNTFPVDVGPCGARAPRLRNTGTPIEVVDREAWREQNPGGRVIYRDLAANPVPHVSADGYLAGRALPSS